PPGGETTWALASQAALYGRMNEWSSLGLRFRGAAGFSSVQGALLRLTLGFPSIAVSFREPLGTASAIELGMHAEGGLHIDASEGAVAERLLFGFGVGAFVTLELGAANGLQLDYTLEAFGFGDRGASITGNVSLAYVHRWD
ncbi:MAG: hypothetical protein K8H88_20355, partial [Sandaracinaceae bacterium]|nr:hypothetical protein [Sandaracinaceae bacterium]